MKFWYSGEVKSDVSREFCDAFNDVEDSLNAKLGELSVGEELESWNSIPIVRPEEDLTPAYCEVKKFRRKDKSIEFRLKIDHPHFKAGDAVAKRHLLIESLLRSVDEARKLVPATVKLDELDKGIREVAREKGWL
jgi:hypothetical protein